MFRKEASFYSEELSAPRPFPKLEDHPLSAVRDCLFNIFASVLHIGARSSIRNLRTRDVVLSLPSKTLNSVALVRERTIPTERPPPVGEVSANFCG